MEFVYEIFNINKEKGESINKYCKDLVKVGFKPRGFGVSIPEYADESIDIPLLIDKLQVRYNGSELNYALFYIGGVINAKRNNILRTRTLELRFDDVLIDLI